jgi:glycosyltransferase involved in cell wall biosynthesis
MADPGVAVVVPVYRNRATLAELASRLHAALDGAGHTDHALYFVDDACPEGSLALLTELAADDPRLGALGLEENVGQHRAVMLGLASCPASRTVVMDADLQDSPEDVPRMLEALEPPVEVVFGGRHGRYQSWHRMFASRVFRVVLHLLTGLPRDACMFMALSRPARDALLELEVPRPYPVALVGALGLRTRSVPVTRVPRQEGESAYRTWARARAGLRALACILECRLGWRTRDVPWRDPAAIPGRRLGRQATG